MRHGVMRLGPWLMAVAALSGSATGSGAPDVPRRTVQRSAVIVIGAARPLRRPIVLHGQRHGVLDINVKPKHTEVWVDGRLRGRVGQFDGFPRKLHLPPGMHRFALSTPDGVVVQRDIRVEPGVEIDVALDLPG